MSSAPTVSILIVSYNTREMTLACIDSVLDQTREQSFEVIVVDNSSTDGSANEIERTFPQVRLIRSSDNLGFARANNLAATKASGRYLLLLNPDTVILDGAIDRLLAFADAHSSARIWGGRTLFGDRSLNPTSCWRFMSLWSLFAQAVGLTTIWRDSPILNFEGYGGWTRNTIREVDIVTGCFLLIQCSLWRELNGFDESFFMYAEEADFCYRARLKGAHPLLTPDATIIHYGGASEGARAAKTIKLFSGKINFIRKHWSPLSRFLGINLFKLNALIRVTGYKLLAALAPTEGRMAAAKEWRTVWAARNEWAQGYAFAS